jgi:hypothetical protein
MRLLLHEGSAGACTQRDAHALSASVQQAALCQHRHGRGEHGRAACTDKFLGSEVQGAHA